MEQLAIHFLNEEGEPVTPEAVEKLVRSIRENGCRSAWLALDEFGEEEFLSVDIENGWAALSYNAWDEKGEAHQYQPVNPAYSASQEEAPVYIGGQTPVLKRNALDNLNLAADCVAFFAKTGKLYSGLQWEEAE